MRHVIFVTIINLVIALTSSTMILEPIVFLPASTATAAITKVKSKKESHKKKTTLKKKTSRRK